MADNSFENTIMQSIKIACLSSLREDGLISDRQYDELLDRISEMSSKAAEKQRESKKAAGQDMEQQEKTIALTRQEEKLIRLIRSIGYGEVRVIIKENGPIRAEEIRRSIQLTEK